MTQENELNPTAEQPLVDKKEKKEKEPKKPKGWVRWTGLGAFVGIVAAVVALGYFGVTQVLKSQIEHYASQAWGAKIEIGSLDLGIFPLKVGLRDLEVTDPDKPMENLVVLKQISASMSLYHLVVGRTVIEDLIFRDLLMHQARDVSGALPDAPKPTAEEVAASEAESSGFEMPGMSIPNPDDILKREKLETMEAANRIETQLAELENEWESLQADLPTEQAWQSYEKRFSDLTSGDFGSLSTYQAKQREFETLQKDLERQKAALEKARDLLQTKLPALQKDVVALKDLPEKDLARLQSKYSLDQSGASNVTHLLFGPKIQYWTDEGMKWYRKAEPFIERLRAMQAEKAKEEAEQKARDEASKRAFGTEVAFQEYDPQPDFIIKRINGSAVMDWGRLQAKVTQVTFDHPTTKLPVKFSVEAMPNEQKNPLTIIGQSNFINADAPVNEADISWKGYQIDDWRLSEDKSMPVVMQQGATDVTGKVALLGVDQVKANIDLLYRDVAMDLSESDSSDVKRYIAPIFADIKQFTVKSDVTGSIMSPKIGAKSDLDQLLSKAFNKTLNKEISKAKADLEKQLKAMMADEIGPIDDQLKALLGDQFELDKDYKNLDKMLNASLEDQWKAEQKKYEDQARAEAEKKQKELEAQAKKEAEEALKRETDKVGDQLKGMFKF